MQIYSASRENSLSHTHTVLNSKLAAAAQERDRGGSLKSSAQNAAAAKNANKILGVLRKDA